MLSLNKSYNNRKVSLTIHWKYKYFDFTVQRAEDRRQKFYFCRSPFAVNVKLNLTNFFPRTATRRLSTQPDLQTNIWKIRKINRASLSQATSFKLGEYNLLPSIFTLQFRNCVKFNFGRGYFLSDSHTNTVISDRFACPSRCCPKAYFFLFVY